MPRRPSATSTDGCQWLPTPAAAVWPAMRCRDARTRCRTSPASCGNTLVIWLRLMIEPLSAIPAQAPPDELHTTISGRALPLTAPSTPEPRWATAIPALRAHLEMVDASAHRGLLGHDRQHGLGLLQVVPGPRTSSTPCPLSPPTMTPPFEQSRHDQYGQWVASSGPLCAGFRPLDDAPLNPPRRRSHRPRGPRRRANQAGASRTSPPACRSRGAS